MLNVAKTKRLIRAFVGKCRFSHDAAYKAKQGMHWYTCMLYA